METSVSENTLTFTARPVRCRHLRSKEYYMDLPFHPSGQQTGHGTPCWCFRTQQVFGPDGESVARGRCTTDRSCFEQDDL